VAIFDIYKSGQGKWVRWGTIVGLGILISAGMYWLGARVLVGIQQPLIRAAIVTLFGALGSFGAFFVANHPRTAEFMIMTESEMRKVNWPSRQVVLSSTKVVIVLTLLFAFMLFIVDYGFVTFFSYIKLLSKSAS